jgi:rare lipoprotein A
MVASSEKRFSVPDNQDDDAVDSAAIATALQSTAVPVVTTSFDLMENYVQLPDIGPIPAERPSRLGEGNIALSAYAAIRIDTASEPFEYVLADGDKLDAEAIRRSASKRVPGLY